MNSFLKDSKAISTIALLILLVASGTIGAILSYLWTAGYYFDLGIRVPEGVTTITIMNATFLPEDSTYFNVTVLHPTYSDADASITGVAIITDTNVVTMAGAVEPPTPYPLRKGEDVTFICNLNWGEYAGQSITVAVFVKDGSGATKSYLTESVKLEIMELTYYTTITFNEFNVTIENPSNIALNVSQIRLGVNTIPSQNITINGQNITFPYTMAQNESKIFTCQFSLWNPETASGYLGMTHDITIETVQGYKAVHTESFSNPVILSLSNVTYPQLNSTEFILKNDLQSPHHVNLGNITISVGNQTFTVNTNVTTGYNLEKGNNVTILCEDENLNWDNWRDEVITIRVYTLQGFLAKTEETVPST